MFPLLDQVKPSSNQVNLASCCVMPPDLTAFAKEFDIQLLTHNDPKGKLNLFCQWIIGINPDLNFTMIILLSVSLRSSTLNSWLHGKNKLDVLFGINKRPKPTMDSTNMCFGNFESVSLFINNNPYSNLY